MCVCVRTRSGFWQHYPRQQSINQLITLVFDLLKSQWSIDHSGLWLVKSQRSIDRLITMVFDYLRFHRLKLRYHPLNDQFGLWLPWIPSIERQLCALITSDTIIWASNPIDRTTTLFFDYLENNHLNFKSHRSNDHFILRLPHITIIWTLNPIDRTIKCSLITLDTMDGTATLFFDPLGY